MTPELESLGRRAVACSHWRWLPGMLTDVGERVTDPDICYLGTFPDLSDPATLGCLLALVREALGDHVWLPTCIDAEDAAWVVDSPSRNRQTRHESYAAALVAALEAAP